MSMTAMIKDENWTILFISKLKNALLIRATRYLKR